MVVALSGGALLAISILFPWLTRGPGSSLTAVDMIRHVAALDGVSRYLRGGRLAVVWFLVPACGTLLWVAVGVLGANSRTARSLAIAGTLMSATVSFALVRLPTASALGSGGWMALLGGAIACIGTSITSKNTV